MSKELENLKDDRELVVIALQALHRERVNSYNSSVLNCEVNSITPHSKEAFGIGEVSGALKRIGAAPGI